MSAALSMSAESLSSAHRRFEAALPAMDRTFRFLFRRTPRHRRAEVLSDARAAAWHAWHGLLRRGQDPAAVGVSGIAANAARYVKAGRRLGTGTCGRGAMDVFHPRAQAACGFRVVSLDSEAEVPAEPSFRGDWLDWLGGDNNMTPADEACFRLDFSRWLSTLPERKCRVAELLAEGHEGNVVARMLGLSQGRVSQVRAELEASWAAFQAEPVRP